MSRDPIAQAETAEWHAARNQGFGASEAAAVAGLSQYETPLHVYLRKRGELPATEETKPMRRGKRWEPYVLDQFQEETGLEIAQAPCGLYRHDAVPFMLATPDAILANGELVDAKTTTFRQAAKFGAEGSDELPVEYVCQGQQQMAVVGAEVCHFAVMLDVWTLKIYRVERNDELIDGLIDAERELWDRIQAGDPPEPTWGHDRTADLVRRMNRFVSDRVIELAGDVAACWDEYERLGQIEREAKKARDEMKARVEFAMGEARAAILPGGTHMIRRNLTRREGYTVEPCEFIDTRKVKVPKGIEVT